MMRYAIPTRIGAAMTAMLLAALAVITVIRPPIYADPLAQYDPILPGQPARALVGYTCNSTYHYAEVPNEGFYCHIFPADGPFELVTVIVQGDTIFRVWYQTTGLRLGDLVHRWGRPDLISHGKRVHIARWSNGVYATARGGTWFTLDSPVNFVSITKLPPPNQNRL